MAGLSAKFLKSANKIGTIIGLDPTSVGFSSLKPEKRLDRSDAMYVQVIHTDINRFGIANPIGHGRCRTILIFWSFSQGFLDLKMSISKMFFS